MVTRELMIGNWIQLETLAEYQVEGHHLVDNEDGYNVALDLSIPIPLTEEWLLKFGFESPEYTHGLLKKGIINVVLREDSHDIFICIEGYVEIINEGNKYNVHQLQNLYSCLTGEELTIK